MQPKKRLILSRNILLVFVITLIYTTGSGTVIFLLPIVADKIFNNFLLVGLMIGLSGAFSMLSAVPFGALSGHIGRKWVLAIGLVIGGAIGLVLQYTTTPFLFLLLMVLCGLGNAAVNTSARSFVMDISPKKRESEYFSLYTTAMSLGFVLGPLIAGDFLSGGFENGVYCVSLIFMATCTISFIILFFLKESVGNTKVFSAGFRELIKNDKVFLRSFSDFRRLGHVGLLILFVTALLSLSDRLIWTIEPLYYQSNIPSLYVGVIMSMFILPYVLFEIPAGLLADRYGKFKVLLPGLFLAGFSLIAFSMVSNVFMMIFFAFMTTTGFSLTWPSLSGLLTEVSSKHEKGNIVGVWNLSEDLGFTLGPLLGGFTAYYFHSISAPFMILGGLLILSFCVMFFVSRR
ncbi:MAG: MFS transporter [Candidatus Altiarchaeota archaeon]|nr:MFS transporter [Candidatus Altiarchaeota archaeon]